MNSNISQYNNNSERELMDLVREYYNLATVPEINKEQARHMKEILEQALKNEKLGEWIEDINLFLMDQLEDTTENFDYESKNTKTLKELHFQHLNQFYQLKEKYCNYYNIFR